MVRLRKTREKWEISQRTLRNFNERYDPLAPAPFAKTRPDLCLLAFAVAAKAQSLPSDSAGIKQRRPNQRPRQRPRRPALSTRRRLVRSHRYSPSLPPSRHPPPSPLSCTSPPIPSAPSHLTYPFFYPAYPPTFNQYRRARGFRPQAAAVKRRDETRRRGGGERTYFSTM
jgi:hypothetical protein